MGEPARARCTWRVRRARGCSVGSVGFLAEHDLVPARDAGALRAALGSLLLGLSGRRLLRSLRGGRGGFSSLSRKLGLSLRTRVGRLRRELPRICRTRCIPTRLRTSLPCRDLSFRRPRTRIGCLAPVRRPWIGRAGGFALLRLTSSAGAGLRGPRLRAPLDSPRLRRPGLSGAVLGRTGLRGAGLGGRRQAAFGEAVAGGGRALFRRRHRGSVDRRLGRPFNCPYCGTQRRRLLDRYVDQRRLFIRARHRVDPARTAVVARRLPAGQSLAAEVRGVATESATGVPVRVAIGLGGATTGKADGVLEAGLVAVRPMIRRQAQVEVGDRGQPTLVRRRAARSPAPAHRPASAPRRRPVRRTGPERRRRTSRPSRRSPRAK